MSTEVRIILRYTATSMGMDMDIIRKADRENEEELADEGSQKIILLKAITSK